MAKSKPTKGKNVNVFLKEGESFKTIALAQDCSIDFSHDTVDGSSKDDGGWDSPEAGIKRCAITSNSLYAPTEGLDASQSSFDALYAAWVNQTELTIVYGIATNASAGDFPEGGWTAPSGASAYSGLFRVQNVSWAAPNGQNSTISATFASVGEVKPLTA